MKLLFLYILYSSFIIAIPLSYEPAELSFINSNEQEFACLMHEGFCIVSVPKKLGKNLENLYQNALKENIFMMINRKEIPNILTSEDEIDEYVKFGPKIKQREKFYFFDFSQISYKNNLLGEGGKIIFKTPNLKKKSVEITSEILMMDLIRQIEFIRRNKKTLRINFDSIIENAGNNDAHSLKLLSIDPRIPSY